MSEVQLELDEEHLRKTRVALPKCPECKKGPMELTDMCCGSPETIENYHCTACGFTLEHKGIFALEVIVKKKLEALQGRCRNA